MRDPRLARVARQVRVHIPWIREHSLHSPEAWSARERSFALRAHRAQVPHTLVAKGVRALRMTIRKHAASLTWEVLVGVRALCQLRGGLVVLRAVGGRRSSARFQSCIFCSRTVRNATVHVLGSCPAWSQRRRSFMSSVGFLEGHSCGQIALAFLRSNVTSPFFGDAVRWAEAISREASIHWRLTDMTA